MFHILYDGTVMDETDFAVLGGEAEAIADRLEAGFGPGLDLAAAVRVAAQALSGPDRSLAPGDLEVAVLARGSSRRTFARIEADELAGYLPAATPPAADTTATTPAPATDEPT